MLTDKYLAALRYDASSDWQLFTLYSPETLNFDEQVARLGQRRSLNTHLQEVTIGGQRRTSSQRLTLSEHRRTPRSAFRRTIRNSAAAPACHVFWVGDLSLARLSQTDRLSLNQTLSYASAQRASDL